MTPTMTFQKTEIEKPRASRDGHEFHETWAARRALKLLLPGDDDLRAIAMEGLSPTDQQHAPAAAVEIADLTMYFGGPAQVDLAARTCVCQFKYSIRNADVPFRASEMKETIAKFSKTFVHHRKTLGASLVDDRLSFQIVTNRPAHASLLKAISTVAAGGQARGDVAKEMQQLQKASGLNKHMLQAFLKKLSILSRAADLPAQKDALESLLVDWSGANDAMAQSRLGRLRQLVRDKAGHAGTRQNLIQRTDILAALQVADLRDLLPCEPLLVDVGPILLRLQLSMVTEKVLRGRKPVLVRATGGVGKTVFLRSLVEKLGTVHEVLFFDCFGGGSYRSVEDARHLPKRGLIHIANSLALRGLCDPMLPDNTDVQALFGTFRRRLNQVVATLGRTTPLRKLILVIDAIDNADIVAGDRREDCFPTLLLGALHTNPVDGVHVVVSCRPERQPESLPPVEPVDLRPFSEDETAVFLRTRRPAIRDAQIGIAQARSAGNARVLEYLVSSNDLLGASETQKVVELDDLIKQRIERGLEAARQLGHDEKDIRAFLAGLATLPPPIPLAEYAGALGLSTDAIESFAADLSPLLERTREGLTFRDEPTETFVHTHYAARNSLARVANNLAARQADSVYAARALPGLLALLNKGKDLFKLAFDERIPSAIMSSVGKRNIRYARLKAAARHASENKQYDHLVPLLVELSTVAATEQRGAAYLVNHPDLVASSRDSGALRRLFEAKTSWPGTRHACLAIANTLLGEYGEAARHTRWASEWIDRYLRTPGDERDPSEGPPTSLTVAAVVFFWISRGEYPMAARCLEHGWRDWFAFEINEFVLDLMSLAKQLDPAAPDRFHAFAEHLTGAGSLASAIAFQEFSKAVRKQLIETLARRCKDRVVDNGQPRYRRERPREIYDGLRKASAVALADGHAADALAIAARTEHPRPRLWDFRDHFDTRRVFPFVFVTALNAAAKRGEVNARDLLPEELTAFSPRRALGSVNDVAAHVQARIERNKKSPPGEASDKDPLASYESRQNAERFLKHHLSPLHCVSQALSVCLAADRRTLGRAFDAVLSAWRDASTTTNEYSSSTHPNPFFDGLGFETACFILWARSDLKPAAVQRFVDEAMRRKISIYWLLRIVETLARRKDLHVLAGKLAQKIAAAIDREHDVGERSSLYGTLARAMQRAGLDEASAYFRIGLEQMDALGSGDYAFVNDLLLFANSLHGKELGDTDAHALSNICELNLSDEPEKFFWGAYGRGMANVAGIRGLAKLARWDDRGKIGLGSTLLPYLIGLVHHAKVKPLDAIALNELARPSEHWGASTKEFAAEIRRAHADANVVLELIRQLEGNDPSLVMDDTLEELIGLAKTALGTASPISLRLSATKDRYTINRDTLNARNNPHSAVTATSRRSAAARAKRLQDQINAISRSIDVANAASLTSGISRFEALGHVYDFKDAFFAQLRGEVSFNHSAVYIRGIAAHETLNPYWKLDELERAKQLWESSSAGLKQTLRELALPLLRSLAKELIHHDRLSGHHIAKITTITGVGEAELVLDLVATFTQQDDIAGGIWLALAAFLAPKTKPKYGKEALERLLSSSAARHADAVADGPWAPALVVNADFDAIAAGMIWQRLGSPRARNRWRAAHSMRTFARFGRWKVIDHLVARYDHVSAGAFGAAELPFFYLHARLWLIIALARIAKDSPVAIARYKTTLLRVIRDADSPHVLMRQFAARALRACIESRALTLPASTVDSIQATNRSPYPTRVPRLLRDTPFDRPKGAPPLPFEFHLDYDFHRYDVTYLASAFSQPTWKVGDAIAKRVHALDGSAKSMDDAGGREIHRRSGDYRLTDGHHAYGQHLAWHALFIVAGELLRSYPVADTPFEDGDLWEEWLSRDDLTRGDGLWLSDGTDLTPLETRVNLLAHIRKEWRLTGDTEVVRALLESADWSEEARVVVNGRWSSADGVRVNIVSALVEPGSASRLTRELIKTEPTQVWLPVLSPGDTEEYSRNEKDEFTPWVVEPHVEIRLDKYDPWATPVANARPTLSRRVLDAEGLSAADPFGRMWKLKDGRTVLSVQAWGRDDRSTEDGPTTGTRLFCSRAFLRRLLKKYKQDLLVLVKLERYEKANRTHSNSRCVHTVYVLHFSNKGAALIPGKINHANVNRY